MRLEHLLSGEEIPRRAGKTDKVRPLDALLLFIHIKKKETKRHPPGHDLRQSYSSVG